MKDNKSIPIVFVYQGNHAYLEFAIRQAIHSNPQSPIYLVGDESNAHFGNTIHHIHWKDLSEPLAKFEAVFKHLSSIPYEMDILWYNRWFLLLELMKKENLSHVFVCDSDILIYNDLNAFYEKHIANQYKGGVAVPPTSEPYGWTVSGHNSFWTFDLLQMFCDFMMDTYENRVNQLQEKYDYHLQHKLPGGICDMTIIYLFYQEKKADLINLLSLFSGENKNTFDYNINYGNNQFEKEYEVTSAGKKKITFKNKKPFGTTSNSEEVCFNTLHFQGGAKKLMAQYYTGEKFGGYSKTAFKLIYEMVKSKLKQQFSFSN